MSAPQPPQAAPWSALAGPVTPMALDPDTTTPAGSVLLPSVLAAVVVCDRICVNAVDATPDCPLMPETWIVVLAPGASA